MRQAWKGFMDALPDETLAATEWSSTATNTGPLPMPAGDVLPSTGKTVTLSGMDIAEVVGGKVKRHAFYWDNASFLEQLGLMPAAEGAAAG